MLGMSATATIAVVKAEADGSRRSSDWARNQAYVYKMRAGFPYRLEWRSALRRPLCGSSVRAKRGRYGHCRRLP